MPRRQRPRATRDEAEQTTAPLDAKNRSRTRRNASVRRQQRKAAETLPVAPPPGHPIQSRVAGVSFDNRDGTPRQPFVRRVRPEQRLHLHREPQNPYDANAIGIWWEDTAADAHQLGYLPRTLAGVLAPLIDLGVPITALAVRAKKVPRFGAWARPVWGLRIVLYGDFRQLPEHIRSGLEPAIARAIETDENTPEPGYAPALGGDRAR